MISEIIVISLMAINFVCIEDTQLDWIESCYGENCTGYTSEPKSYEDNITYWNYRINI